MIDNITEDVEQYLELDILADRILLILNSFMTFQNTELSILQSIANYEHIIGSNDFTDGLKKLIPEVINECDLCFYNLNKRVKQYIDEY